MTAPSGHDVDGLLPAPEVLQIEVGLLQNFCEILYCPDARRAAVVDPAWEVDRLLRAASDVGATIDTILLTHTHNDHIEGVEAMVAATGARVFVHPFEADKVRGHARDLVEVRDRLDIPLGQRGIRALETFGHTSGGTCYLADGFLIAGDVLFVGGCGRTDFPGGNTAALWHSLRRLMALPEETIVYPGHDYGRTPRSTIGREILENPYLRCADLAAFRDLRERKRKA